MKMFVGDQYERRKKSRKGNWTTPEGALQDGVTRDSRPGRENKALEKGSRELIWTRGQKDHYSARLRNSVKSVAFHCLDQWFQSSRQEQR